MRVFIAVIILIFSLQSWTKADDIRDFEIEDMSIGDSLLNFTDRKKILKEIKRNAKYYKQFIPKNKFGEVYLMKTVTYDQISVFVKTDDPNYKIYMFRGMLNFNNNINKCLEKKSEITKDIENLFNDFKKRDYKVESGLDSTGRSYTLRTAFSFKNDDRIIVQCSDWEESFRKKNNFGEGISVIIQTKEAYNWFLTAN